MPLPLPPERHTGDGDPAGDVNLLSAAVAELQDNPGGLASGMGPQVLYTFTEADLVTSDDTWYGSGAVVTFVEWTPDRAGRLQIYPPGRGDLGDGVEAYLFTAADYPNRTDNSSTEELAYADDYVSDPPRISNQVDVIVIPYVVAVLDWEGSVGATVDLSPLLMSLAALGGVDPLPETRWPLISGADGLVPMALSDLRALVNDGAHAEGDGTTASGNSSHAEGQLTVASGPYSHAEGYGTTAGYVAHAEGANTTASGAYSHAENLGALASGSQSHAEGDTTIASGAAAHAEGIQTTASAQGSHAEGGTTTASAIYSHAEGFGCNAAAPYAHAEGRDSTAAGESSHAEGQATYAAEFSHAEGYECYAYGSYSHAEGKNAQADGPYSHARSGGYRFSQGDHQYVSRELCAITSDALPSQPATARDIGTEILLPINRVVGLRALVAARSDDGTLGKAWQVTAAARTDGSGNVTILGSPDITVLGGDGGATGWDVEVGSFTSNLRLTCTGSDGAGTIYWSITAETKEVG